MDIRIAGKIMHAMVLDRPGSPLMERTLAARALQPGEVRIRVSACAVCRTDLHVVDGELPDPKLPIVPGHEIVGRIVELGTDVTEAEPEEEPHRALHIGDRVGVPWLGWTCGVCEFCRRGEENLCVRARFTGYQIDGGFAEETIADARYVFPLPDDYSDREAAPLMCAGLIGWRALKAAGDAPRLGLYGFGAAAHLAVQAARHRGQEVYGFVRPGDEKAKAFALSMGAVWAGDSDVPPPVPLDAAIIFAPAGELVPAALRAVRHGGRVVCGGIHMSDIPPFPYDILWHERSVRSVANLTRKDAGEFLALAATNKFHTETTPYPLADANRALSDLRAGAIKGAAVLVP
ncbi:MAG TPA: zinc-dependent alcohol dehydrogenase family protein [Rhizomicrobium sp.]|nr:zinc-dependent alcohol dehydrogenase family protein [Rhizomicrobium sp.]